MRLVLVDINVERGPSEGCRAIQASLEQLEPDVRVLHTHWRDFKGVEGDGLILGPNGTPFPAYPPAFVSFLSMLPQYTGPVLGICGGHQALGLAHGATVAPVYDQPAASTSYAGMQKVEGLVTLKVLDKVHPLFRGFQETLTLNASHVDELKTLPRGFTCLATNARSHIQIMAHTTHHQVGVQCHPERLHGAPQGADLLRAWIRIARALI